jgi:hypothetical protein
MDPAIARNEAETAAQVVFLRAVPTTLRAAPLVLGKVDKPVDDVFVFQPPAPSTL